MQKAGTKHNKSLNEDSQHNNLYARISRIEELHVYR